MIKLHWSSRAATCHDCTHESGSLYRQYRWCCVSLEKAHLAGRDGSLHNGSLHNGLFILLKSICAEGLTRRHETECRHATRVRSSRFYMLLILRHISHNIYRISYRNILYHNTVQYSTVQYSTVQCKKRDRREGKKGTRLGFLLGYIAYVAQLNPC